MQIKQSGTLLHHLHTGSMGAQHAGMLSLTADVAFLSLLKDRRSHAGRILEKLLKDWEIYQAGIRIERECGDPEIQKNNSADPRQIIGHIVTGIEKVRAASGVDGGGVANTGHFLLWVTAESGLIASRTLELYGVTAENVEEQLKLLPESEDFHVDLDSLEKYVSNKLITYTRQEDESPQDQYGEEDDSERYGEQTALKVRKGKKPMIDRYAVNMTRAAGRGELDPVIGRESEIERLMQILGRRKKNNPILVGEAGVGKSAIVEGLALCIAGGGVPQSLRGKEIYSLDVASLVAGTKYRGQFEERIKNLLSELCGNKNIILFIDEIHTIVGAGSTPGSLDTANILKPALARGELQCIGATTLDEFRGSIESDGALERRFQKIIVEPTTREQTFTILENISGRYESHHGVRYTPQALRACVELTERYIPDRYFPDKAIDAMDEAGSRVRRTAIPEPKTIRELEAAVDAAMKEKSKAVSARRHDKAEAARAKILALRTRLGECRDEWLREMADNRFVVGVEHIGEVITSMTGIPVERVSQSEKARLGNMNSHLSSRVIGQQTAVDKVVRSIQRSRAGLKDPDKPIGVFMFVGPTGVGKTHLAKELAKWMFDRDNALIRVDMSEYSEKHNISRLIGSPPGYVGYGEGGQLTEAVRRQPYAVVLFDEIEKAHSDVFNVMLQIFDEGQLTDGSGRRVDFRNTVIIMTSNVGSRTVANRPASVGYATSGKSKIESVNKIADYRAALNNTFAPEFINRIDDMVIFNTLSLEDVKKIVDLELNNLYARVDKLGYKLKITGKAKKLLAEMGYEPRYGVRSLKRTILDSVEEPLAQLIMSGGIGSDGLINIGCRGANIELLCKAA